MALLAPAKITAPQTTQLDQLIYSEMSSSAKVSQRPSNLQPENSGRLRTLRRRTHPTLRSTHQFTATSTTTRRAPQSEMSTCTLDKNASLTRKTNKLTFASGKSKLLTTQFSTKNLRLLDWPSSTRSCSTWRNTTPSYNRRRRRVIWPGPPTTMKTKKARPTNPK